MTTAEDVGAEASRIGTAEHFRWLDMIVRVVLVLNLLDAAFTLFWVNAGLAREANPLMNELVVDHPLLFVGAKLGLVSMGSWLLWTHRTKALAVVSIFLSFLVYYLILLYHLDFLADFVRALMAS